MDSLRQLAINEEGFVFNPVTGESWTVNSTGLSILKLLQKGEDEDTIARHIAAEFEVDLETARRDVVDFIEKLRSYRLL